MAHKSLSLGQEPCNEGFYRKILSFAEETTDAAAKGSRLSLSKILDVAWDIVHRFKSPDDLNELLGAALKYYDPKDLVKSHAVNVTVSSLKMAIDMALSEEEIEDSVCAALVHDIGFELIRDKIKATDQHTVTDADRTTVMSHSRLGFEIVIASDAREKRIAEAILQHHESADGTGYPNGLNDSEMCVQSRIISIVDTYEALIHPRPYRDALFPPQGIQAILKQKGTTFSATMVRNLITSLSVFPVGQLVKLNNGYIARVMRTYPETPLRPDVEAVCDAKGELLDPSRIIHLGDELLLSIVECLPNFPDGIAQM